MALIQLPSVRNHLFAERRNFILHHFQSSAAPQEAILISRAPFVVQIDEEQLLLTNKADDPAIPDFEKVILAGRKPTARDLEAQNLKLLYWLKHPAILAISPAEVLDSWTDRFHFVKEDPAANIPGLRPPQLGALHSILGHMQNADNMGIVVMPTGTGKTETMLSTMVAAKCEKLLVTVPSDSLRGQLAGKFLALGLLKEFGIVAEGAFNPVVGILGSKILDLAELSAFIDRANVVVTTMAITSGGTQEIQQLMAERFTHLFVDEAHHSEANTWQQFIARFDKEKVFLFTATPYRNDGKKLKGKFIFNFSLKKAQEQQYYKKINYLPIREYDKAKADELIAEKAVEQLRKDRAAGFQHIIMARCMNKDRANEVFPFYEKHPDLNPVLVYTERPGLSELVRAIRSKAHAIIVCVDMLGEGFDLPELKIAAVHDERQSLPITLQFIGRFTRTAYAQLGEASFITNSAYPPIKAELDQLYAKDSDWNLLLPLLSEAATQKEIDFKEFLAGFEGLDNSNIPFQNINPALSTVLFRHDGDTWDPGNWPEGIANLNTYEHQYSSLNGQANTLVIVLGKISRVDWGDFDTVQNLEWEMIILFWDLRPEVNRIFINTSIKGLKTEKLVAAIFEGNTAKVTGMEVFRIFHEVNRLSLFNVGGRPGIGQDISFRSFYGRGVQDGLDLLEQGTLIKNNIFGVGYKDGEKVSLGCSVKGKIWSYMRGNLDELTTWCQEVGDIVENQAIDPNTVLEHTLQVKKISERPPQIAVAVDWHPEMYQFTESRYEFYLNGVRYYLWEIDLDIDDDQNNANLQFTLRTEQFEVSFEFILSTVVIDGTASPTFAVKQLGTLDARIEFGATNQPLEGFFQKYTPVFWFADGAQLLQNQYVKPREKAALFPLDRIVSQAWPGVALNLESQGIAPYVQNSIQYAFIRQILNDFQIIYDGDGKGEIADVIGINDSDEAIDVHLFHLKYARGGTVGNNIDNFYQVCGQAQKSVNWKYRPGKDFFDQLFRKLEKKENGLTCSRLIKGSTEQLEALLTAAKWTKKMRFHMAIVQPGMAKANVSDDIRLLLGTTAHYLHVVANIDLAVYSS
ncbi:MAG: DEAD/DEAH box helicase family protein [Bacteroidota bacterium]